MGNTPPPCLSYQHPDEADGIAPILMRVRIQGHTQHPSCYTCLYRGNIGPNRMNPFCSYYARDPRWHDVASTQEQVCENWQPEPST